MKTYLVCFSPTGTSFKVGQAIAGGLGGEVVVVNLTLGAVAEMSIDKNDVVVIAAPVYGGHIARVAVERLSSVRGNGGAAVVAAVYGNRHYEGALDELAGIAQSAGFVVVGAGTFVGEHSFSTPSMPIAQGRPDENDLDFAHKFGADMAQKIAKNATLVAIDTHAIQKPKDALSAKLSFIYSVLKLKAKKVPSAKTPVTDAALCSHCSVCVDLCPVGAIEAGSEDKTGSACIRCCACVKGCPSNARTFDTPFAELLSRNFKAQKGNQTIL